MPALKANVDVVSDNKKYTITLEAAGREQKDSSIKLKDQILTINGNKQQEQEERDKPYYRIERCYDTSERNLAVPNDVDII